MSSKLLGCYNENPQPGLSDMLKLRKLGILTERDLVEVAAKLFEEQLREFNRS